MQCPKCKIKYSAREKGGVQWNVDDKVQIMCSNCREVAVFHLLTPDQIEAVKKISLKKCGLIYNTFYNGCQCVSGSRCEMCNLLDALTHNFTDVLKNETGKNEQEN